MGIRTTITLDEDVLERVKMESRSKGTSFRDAVNNLLRAALMNADNKPRRRSFKLDPVHMGYKEGLNYDSTESLLEYGEGDEHR